MSKYAEQCGVCHGEGMVGQSDEGTLAPCPYCDGTRDDPNDSRRFADSCPTCKGTGKAAREVEESTESYEASVALIAARCGYCATPLVDATGPEGEGWRKCPECEQ